MQGCWRRHKLINHNWLRAKTSACLAWVVSKQLICAQREVVGHGCTCCLIWKSSRLRSFSSIILSIPALQSAQNSARHSKWGSHLHRSWRSMVKLYYPTLSIKDYTFWNVLVVLAIFLSILHKTCGRFGSHLSGIKFRHCTHFSN